MIDSILQGQSVQDSRRSHRNATAVLSGAVMALALTACSGGTGTSASTSGAATTAKDYNVGIVQFAGSDPYSSAILGGISAYAKDQGWQSTVIDSGGDVSKALTAMQNLVQQKVDAIVTATYPPKALQGAIAQAKAAGIPVISVIGTGSLPGLVATYDIGKPQGAAIVAQMQKDLAGKKVNLLEITYSPGAGCQAEGAELDAWKTANAAQIVADSKSEVPIPGQVEGARAITASWLEKNSAQPGVQNVIWDCWDDPALGTVAALRAADRKDVMVYGATGEKAAIQAMQDGWMQGDAYTDPLALGSQVGKALPGFIQAGVDAATQSFYGDVVTVSKDNVADFVKQYPQAVK